MRALFGATPKRCIESLGDPYVELSWSRYFGTPRPSRYPGAFPIPEGLAVSVGFGMVIPTGRYSAVDATVQGLTIGNNIRDFAPIVGFTYTTKPIIAESTEITARLLWNNYLTNTATQYATGGVVAYDLPEYGASMKVKVLRSIVNVNTVKSWGVVLGWIKKFR